jgi:SAM-dependent MidA family methyltransferase
LSWRAATQEALYGPDGFYRRELPADHFRTSAHTGSGEFADAIAALLDRVDVTLGRPDPLDLVDVGAGDGELLAAVASRFGSRRLRLTGVEIRGRWSREIPAVTGLLLANEWLDNVPVDVVERDEAGLDRLVLVSPAGEETLGPVVAGAEAAWLARWWPLRTPGERAELGAPREAAWAAAVGRVRRGLALAIDYGHLAADRPSTGTLTGYRAGRQVPPVPDGSCDLTSHVAMDALAAACGGELHRQRDALRALGVSGARPPREQAGTDPLGYLRALAAAGDAAELTDPAGLGGFWWLCCPCSGNDGLPLELDLGLGVPESAHFDQ